MNLNPNNYDNMHTLSVRLKILIMFLSVIVVQACVKERSVSPSIENPIIPLNIPEGFPSVSKWVDLNKPTKHGVKLGESLFNEKKLSGNNTTACASCHNQNYAYADNMPQALGIYGRIGLRNAPPIQNLAFMSVFNWDGNLFQIEKQALVPIITHEEMNSSIVEVIQKLTEDPKYSALFINAFGDEHITPERIYNSLAQYQYTLISADSKYDRVKRNEGESFTPSEARGYSIFRTKCKTCHDTELFTDQSFRNIGFPINRSSEEAGRARVTGKIEDFMSFRVPSLRNAEFTAPYGSFGQFKTLMDLLDYLDNGVIASSNLDPIFKKNGNRIPMNKSEKEDIIAFIKTLSDMEFTKR